VSARLRVVQWATGNIGTYALRGIVDHPLLDLVGLHVHAGEKAGRDAGELCDRPPTGVTATTGLDAILAAAPDCVLYMPARCDADEICRILGAGINVVTTRGEFHRPASMPPDLRERVEDACAVGGASIHSTGSSPGFITEALPLVLSSIQRRLDHLAIYEFADLSQRPSPGLLFDVMGFGRPPESISEQRLAHGRTSFGPSLHLVADAIGLPLDGLEAHGELATARHKVEIAAGTLPAGTVAGQRVTVAGMRRGKELLRFCATWYCTPDLDQAWDVRDTGWRITVDGDAPLEVDLRFPIPLERMASVTPAYTANRAVNAVAAVCAAAPGIRTTLDLPQVIPALV
jgi:2,4-diaminopentanoate dehydrogenase